jgi:NTP pyrophosphatase (non-canonical NTP hydrolase)
MRTPWANPELREFLKQEEHLAPKGFATRILKACYNADRPITTVAELRRSHIDMMPNIGPQTMIHLRHLLLGRNVRHVPLTLSTLRQANEDRQKEWNPDNVITLEFRGNELAGEVGEACNIIKKLAQERLGLRGKRATIAQLAGELADALICLDLVAMQAGIDLASAVEETFNATSAKHGLQTKLGGNSK